MKTKSIRFHRKFVILPRVLYAPFNKVCDMLIGKVPTVAVRRDRILKRMKLTKF